MNSSDQHANLVSSMDYVLQNNYARQIQQIFSSHGLQNY